MRNTKRSTQRNRNEQPWTARPLGPLSFSLQSCPLQCMEYLRMASSSVTFRHGPNTPPKTKTSLRACLTAFSYIQYGETNKQFRACVNIVYGKTSKIKENALSRYPRQANCNVNRTKTYNWISSELTPIDASYSCACLCICTLSCIELNLCAIAVSLPSAANLCLHSQQLRDQNSEVCQQSVRIFRNERCQQNVCWTRTT